jgi:uncharacterized membrane protein
MTHGVRRTLTIGRPVDELLAIWQLPTVRSRVFAHLAELSDDGSRWDPRDGDGTWEVEVVEPEGDGRWQWCGHTGTGDHFGVVWLRDAPSSFGTEVTISVDPVDDADLPALFTSAAFFEALHRFKSLVETGEIPTLDRNPQARHSGPDPH